jgi:formate-dependent nitrite reductase cytochrome c552 subunit
MRYAIMIPTFLLFLGLVGCDEHESNSEKLVFINPTIAELQKINFNPGDTLTLELMHSGNENVLLLNYSCFLEYYKGTQKQQLEFWYGHFDTVPNNESFYFQTVIPDNWSNEHESVTGTKHFKLHMVTDNELLYYDLILK